MGFKDWLTKTRKTSFGCERLNASCCYKWLCLLVSELTIRQIHSYQHPPGSHTQRTIHRRYAQKPFCAQDKQNSFTCMVVLYFQQCSTLHRGTHFRVHAAENCFFLFIVLVVVFQRSFVAHFAILCACECKLASILSHTKLHQPFWL